MKADRPANSGKRDALTRRQVRDFDRIAMERFGMSGLVLMENAARGAVDFLCRLQGNACGKTVILCGPGNNGGDGLVMARHLHLRGWAVSVLMVGCEGPLTGDAQVNYGILTRTAVAIRTLDEVSVDGLAALFADCDWIIDALLGTGSRPPLRPPFAEVVKAANQADCRRFAVDIPTGLDCEGGSEGADPDSPVFSAEATATFVAAKPGMLSKYGKTASGSITIVDIGAPPEVFEFLDWD
jgi:NAD(P)H-hydrate epimerase